MGTRKLEGNDARDQAGFASFICVDSRNGRYLVQARVDVNVTASLWTGGALPVGQKSDTRNVRGGMKGWMSRRVCRKVL